MDLLRIYKPNRIRVIFVMIVTLLLFGIYFIYTQKLGIDCLMVSSLNSFCTERSLPFTTDKCHTEIRVCAEEYNLALARQIIEILLIPYLIILILNYIVLVPIFNKLILVQN